MERNNGSWNTDRDRISSTEQQQQQEQQQRMDIDREEAETEAGTILISMARYTSPYQHRSTTQEEPTKPLAECKRSMSIQSLLDTKPDHRSSAYQQQQQHESNGNSYGGSSTVSISEYRPNGINTRVSERSFPKPEVIKQEAVYGSSNPIDKATYTTQKAAECLTKQHHLIMRSYQSQPMTDLGNYNHDDPKQTPKIKRNALHAYISYMIYTDLSHHHNPFDGKLPTPKDTPTGFTVVMNNHNNNNSNNNNLSERPAYPFPTTMTFQKMSNMLSEGIRRSETSITPSRPPMPNSTGSLPLLLDQQQHHHWNNSNNSSNNMGTDIGNQVPQQRNSILHKPLTAYLRSTPTSEQQQPPREIPSSVSSPPEGFRPRLSASMPISPGMPPNHHHHHHGRKF
ncbi:hypothetical protein BDA99DRAFT_541927 [Phascolomyces articulosus]|uniref:Uncharacterized protein n=1 Tax=Phascolomyces articulosus TaxID=60185 RepID=A0AAD5K0F6_9FUNG|nr:hypothetical protein BDA99DRAFT_541927 [Phascolomyces articulosus]